MGDFLACVGLLCALLVLVTSCNNDIAKKDWMRDRYLYTSSGPFKCSRAKYENDKFYCTEWTRERGVANPPNVVPTTDVEPHLVTLKVSPTEPEVNEPVETAKTIYGVAPSGVVVK